MRLKYIFIILFFSLARVVFAQGYDQQLKEYEKEIKNKQQELQRLYKEIEKLDQETEKTKKKEKSYHQEINKVENEIRFLLDALKKLENKKKQIEKQVQEAEKMYQLTEEERIRLANLLKQEIKFFYTLQKLSPDLRKDYYLLNFIKQKGNVYELTENKKKQIEKKKSLLLEKREETVQEKDKIQRQEKTVVNLKKEKEQILTQLKTQRITQEKEIDNLKKAATDLEKFIFDLEGKKKETEKTKKQAVLARKAFAEKKGYLPWPINGEVVAKFGRQKHLEFNTYIVNNGIKIRSKGEKNVSAVAQGKVVFAGNFQTYGKMVILDHQGGFYSIYGSLNEILVKEGRDVLLGEQIGNLGDGSLYFELRSEGQPVDPLPWLQK